MNYETKEAQIADLREKLDAANARIALLVDAQTVLAALDVSEKK